VIEGDFLQKRLSTDIRLLESTLIAPDQNGKLLSFADAEKAANERKDLVTYAVDLRVARDEVGIQPLKSADPYRYLKYLVDTCSWIDIRGLQTGSGEAHRFPIDDLYMTLTTKALSDERELRGTEETPKKIP